MTVNIYRRLKESLKISEYNLTGSVEKVNMVRKGGEVAAYLCY